MFTFHTLCETCILVQAFYKVFTTLSKTVPTDSTSEKLRLKRRKKHLPIGGISMVLSQYPRGEKLASVDDHHLYRDIIHRSCSVRPIITAEGTRIVIYLNRKCIDQLIRRTHRQSCKIPALGIKRIQTYIRVSATRDFPATLTIQSFF